MSKWCWNTQLGTEEHSLEFGWMQTGVESLL